MDKEKRAAIVRLVVAAVTFVLLVAGLVVLILTRSPILIAVGFALLLVSNVIWLPADIRIVRRQLAKVADRS